MRFVPQLMPQFPEYALEPACVPAGFNPLNAPGGEPSVESPRLPTAVFQTAFDQLPRLLVQHRNLLVARVQITSYNLHRSAPFLRALIRLSAPSLLARKEPTRLSNRSTLFYSAEIRRPPRSDRGSSPCSTPPRSLSQTSPWSPCSHRLPRGHAVASANRKSDRHGCRST